MQLINPNTEYFDNFFDKKKYLLAWRISLVFSIVFSTLSIVLSFGNQKSFITSIIVIILIAISWVLLIKTKKYKLLFWIYAISGTIILNFSINYILDTVHFMDFLWMVSIILLAFIGLGKNIGKLFIFLNAIGIIYFFWFSLNDHILSLKHQSKIEIISVLTETLLALFTITYLIQLYLSFLTHNREALKNMNLKLNKKNKENTTLVKEIHHRVKNNLQIIISLLRLQKDELKSEEAKKHFAEAINRIMVMSLIHKKLYQDKELANLDIEAYLTDLANDIKSISELKIPLQINVCSEIKTIGLKTIVPLGLIVNELISNSLKHAFINKHQGVISISVCKSDNNLILLDYSDNGTWIPPDDSNSSFGIELIDILTAQIEGKYIRNESTYNFTLKNLDI